MNADHNRIAIVGAGLVGSLLGIMLAQRGHRVAIYERRQDMRTNRLSAGRSINLAMSDRGLRALEIANIADHVRKISIPMYGRMIHDEVGNTRFQPYGVGDQAINSVSRAELNKTLMTAAENHGVKIHFDHRCQHVDLDEPFVDFYDIAAGKTVRVRPDLVFGADGAFSAVRNAMMISDRFDYSQSYLEHSYKELHIPPAVNGGFKMEQNALHIWPRHSFMLIALPNLDGSFTCTLFLAHEGNPSFAMLQTEADVLQFFSTHFPDALQLMPTLCDDFFANPESSLVTVKCSPWVRNTTALIGDAAHAIVPFYGQGMNCGFEDCSVLMECVDVSSSWKQALALYQAYRKQDADAIADLAVENFVEMRDKVADEHFLLRKKLEAFLHAQYPDRFIPLYTLVTFSAHVPYHEAQRIGRENDVIIDLLVAHEVISKDWNSPEAREVFDSVIASRKPLAFKPLGPRTSA